MADDRKSSEEPKGGAISPEQKPADLSYWAELIELVHDGWTMALMGCGKRHAIGRFEGIRLIGEGGNGVVFLVRDPELDREVALKLCRVPRAGADEAILREAQLLAKLSHRNIITVHETGRYGEDVFYVMEQIVGMNGHELIYRSGGWQQVIEVYIAAGTGLAVAHEHGIIHGDFKPGNILIPEDGGPVRVADFGLARVMYEDGAGIPHRVGTLPYMAPEVLRGQPGDARSDQWSFCVALWQTLEAVLPYSGETVSELLAEIEQSEPRVAEPWVPERVRSVVRVGLSIDPEGRYPDMRVLVHELGKLLASPGGTVAAGESSEGRAVESEGRLLNRPSGPTTQPVGRAWFVYGFLAALVGGVVSAIVLAPIMRADAPAAVEPLRETEVPGVPEDPVVEILARVQADEFAEAEKLWRETRALTEEESLAIGLACVGRAKQLQASDAAKADEAVELAAAISARLHGSAPRAGNPIDVALQEHNANKAAHEQ